MYSMSYHYLYFLAKLGADVAGSPAEVASQVNRVVTMLPESSHVQNVYAGENGVFR